MESHQAAFPTRLLREGGLEGLEDGPPPDPARINEHIEPNPSRVMTDDQVDRLLNDPFATLVLRTGTFPKSLPELLSALDAHNGAPEGLPDTSSFLVAEGGQIPFEDGQNNGGSRLIVVRGRNGMPELMINVLAPPSVSPRAEGLLLEVIAWDPKNKTFHFYQRQSGVWFWCGQSDMALVAPTRGEGPFDSHINGYVVMKELKAPWVHWHGPDLQITETAYALNDPMVTDPLFLTKDFAFNFEMQVIRPLARRWNDARFIKAVTGGVLEHFDQYARQLLDATSANLISTRKEWSRIGTGEDLEDVPPTFFADIESLVGAIGLNAEVPPLVFRRNRYQALAQQHGLRVRDPRLNVDRPGDVPFCFTVPERAFEDVLALEALLHNGILSPRLAAALLMVDFPNPVGSPRRTSLLAHMPASVNAANPDLDTLVVVAIQGAGDNTAADSPEREFLANWQLGPDAWKDAYADRLESYFGAIRSRLDTDDGTDDIFRLAESRRRQFRKRPLSEFGLTLPQATNIAEDAPLLEMTPQAIVQPTTA
jgi:hypothetical protein